MNSTFQQILSAIAFFILGSLYPVVNNTILSFKFRYKNNLELEFRQPWLQTFLMFFGMSFFMIPTLIKARCKSQQNSNRISGFQLYRIVFVPVFINIIAAILSTYCLMYMPVHIWQIFNEFSLLFNALFSAMFKHSQLFFSDWIGLFFVVIGISFAGVFSLLRSISEHSSTTTELFFSFILQILCHCFRSFSSIGEEFLLKESTPITIIGFEGLWGIYIIGLIFLPLSNVNKSDYAGIYEVSADIIPFFQNSKYLILLELLFIICVSFYRYARAFIMSSSVNTKSLYESFFPISVWLISFLRYLVVGSESTKFFDSNSAFELIGLIITLFGSLLYHRVIKLPCFLYSKESNNSDVHSMTNDYLLD